MTNILARLGIFSIGTIGSAAMNLLMIPMTTYFLTPEEYGKTNMFFLVQSMLIYVIYLGFDQAFTREFHDYDDKKKLLSNALIIPILWTSFLAIILSLFAKQVSFLLYADSDYQLSIYLLGASTIFLVFERFTLLYLRMKNQAWAFSLYSIMLKFSILLAVLMVLLFGQPFFINVVYGSILGQLTGQLLLIVIHWRLYICQRLMLDKSLLKRLTQFGLPIVCGTLIYSLLLVVDKLFIRYFCNYAELGLYTAAFKIASALMVIQVSFANFWVPTAYEWHRDQKPVSYYRTVSDVVMFLMACCFLLLLLMKNWIVILLSAAYTETQYIFPFLCFYPLMMTVSETTNLGIVFQKKSHLNIVVSLISFASSLGLNLLLVKPFGAVGAAVATGTAYAIFFLVRTWCSMRVWEGFSVKKHVCVTAFLYLLTLYVTFSKQILVERVLILGGFVLLFVLYKPLFTNVVYFFKHRQGS